jgi:predicted alpha/beta-fold hydrolase
MDTRISSPILSLPIFNFHFRSKSIIHNRTVNLILKPCRPPFWARNRHLQTLLGHVMPRTSLPMPSARVQVRLTDGDALSCLYYEGKSDVVVYLFHGLGGDASSGQMQSAAKVCLDLGHSVYLVNHRGCGDGESLAIGPYHCGRGEDISDVIAFGRSSHSNKRHLALGFSLGGNAILCLLTGLRCSVLPDYAITVNAPIDLVEGARRIKLGLNPIYDFLLSNQLRRQLRRRQKYGKVSVGLLLRRFMTLYYLDKIFTVPFGGFESVEQFYETCSTVSQLSKIKVPTLLFAAQDDPLVSFRSYEVIKPSSSIYLHSESIGGHMGYATRTKGKFGVQRWLDYALQQSIPVLLRTAPFASNLH